MDKTEVQEIVKQALAAEKRRQLKKKLILVATTAIFTPVFLYAASIAIPNTFSDGDTLSAGKLNENFNTLLTKINDLDAKIAPLSGKSMALICEIDVTTAVTSIDTSVLGCTLNGDSDKEYIIIERIKNGFAGSTNYVIQPNGDSTVGNYGYQHLNGTGGAAAAAQQVTNLGLTLGFSGGLNQYSSDISVMVAKSGHPRIHINTGAQNVTGNTVSTAIVRDSVWTDTSSNITSLKIVADQTNGIGVGSHIEIWARR